jgi:hypothetical protein
VPETTFTPGADDAATPGAENVGARLERLERRVAAQASALAAVPLNMPVPRHVIALMATAPHELDGAEMPLRYWPRLVKLIGELDTMIGDVTLRERELAGRIATVRSARRAGPAPHLLDYKG